jgi:HEPN domain-containing protein
VVGFHVQQSAEKMLKALLILAGRDVPKLHDISTLMDSLTPELALPTALADTLRDLTPWAVAGRYPAVGRYRGPTTAELTAALEAIDRLADVVATRLGATPA